MTAALVFDPIPAEAPIPVAVVAAAPVAPGVGAVLPPEVYRRRRLAAVAVIVGLVLGLASFGRQADATRTPAAEAAAAVQVVVQPGDTLWAIAESLAPDTDPRPLVAALAAIAGDTALQPGQLLTVPGELLD